MNIPNDFPRFRVPGCERQTQALRELYWHHLIKAGPTIEEWIQTVPYPVLPFGRTGPLWDAWLCTPHLWPAVDSDNLSARMRENWGRSLSCQPIDDEGFVATLQSHSYAHNDGWPIPCWHHTGGTGWHFSYIDTKGIRADLAFRPPALATQEGWKLGGLQETGMAPDGWHLHCTGEEFSLDTPPCRFDTQQGPFMQVRWSGNLPADAQPYLAWTTDDKPDFDHERRMYFDPPGAELTRTMLPMYRHPLWTGTITGFRVGVEKRGQAPFSNDEKGASPHFSDIVLVAVFSHYDTRHNINNACFIQGCANYFAWTGDLTFLRRNIDRIRRAMHYMIREFGTREHKVVLTPWIGHDGRSMVVRGDDGQLRLNPGHGIGNNYADMHPFGHKDCYATVHFYAAAMDLAALEEAALRYPQWNVHRDVLAFDPADLRAHAEEVREAGNRLFWNERAGRFIACIDADGLPHDYGYTLLNAEAVTTGFATPEHARRIMEWLDGRRTVEGDTSQGADIYHWRFAPRWNTLENTDWWSTLPPHKWNMSVLNGGAILGWSYQDILARAMVLGGDNAWKRMGELADWFAEVQAGGGYIEYYKKRDAGLQGAGTGGALGINQEFLESVMPASAMLTALMGFAPTAEGFTICPRLPRDWPELTIDRVRWRGMTLRLRATQTTIEIATQGAGDAPMSLNLPMGKWQVTMPSPGHPVAFSRLSR